MRSYEIEVATIASAEVILELTNEAFMADAFFKKPEYHLRFDRPTVHEMIQAENSAFLLAKSNDDEGAFVGSLYLHWEIVRDNHNVQITGKFSAVSVPPKYEKRGVGKALVKGAESKILEIARDLQQQESHHIHAVLQMGVINLRKDLFPWYESQGFETICEIRPNDPEVETITLDEMKDIVCCVLMKKILKI